jgi:hypothetical protein
MDPWKGLGQEGMHSTAMWVWANGAGSSTHVLCRTSPHRCLLSARPAPTCATLLASPTVRALSPGGGEQFVGLDDEYVYGCDNGARQVIRCDVGGTWVVRNNVASYNGYWLNTIVN